MEENKEMKNGMISEEALDEIAGGLSVKKGLLIGALAAAGVGVAGAGALAAWKHFGKKEQPDDLQVPKAPPAPNNNPNNYQHNPGDRPGWNDKNVKDKANALGKIFNK